MDETALRNRPPIIDDESVQQKVDPGELSIKIELGWNMDCLKGE